MFPSAPLTFSMMMGCLMRSAKTRPTKSAELPAAFGTIVVMGCVGSFCALAIRDAAGSAAAPAARCRNR
jgi:hypothetical protein